MRTVYLSCLLLACFLGFGVAGAEEAQDYKALEKALKTTWKVDKEAIEKPRLLKKLRERKQKTADALEATGDPRAIAAFGKAHKQQMKFAGLLESEWAERREKWQKLEKPMRRALAGRPVAPDGTVRVTPGEKKWLNEEKALQALFKHFTEEEDIGKRARTAMSTILQSLEGNKRKAGIKAFQSAIGKGETPVERDFVRALGITSGDDVTAALLQYATADSSPLSQTALRALGVQNAPGNIDHLLGFLKDERWQVRAAAIGGLGYFKDARVVAALIEAAKNEQGVLQRHCFVAISRVLGEAMPGGVDAWSRWWTEHQARFIEKWTGQKPAPVRREPAPVMLRQGQGHTSFYGIQTNSKHVVFIIDRSGSMKEPAKGEEDKVKPKNRLEVAKAELKQAIKSLGSDESDERGAASFNVVSYAGDVTVYKPGKMVEATVKAKENVFKWIDALEPLGPTNIYDAIEAAFNVISVRKKKKNAARGADTFFLMTDGEPTTGKVTHPDLIRKETVRLNLTRQIIIHTIEIKSKPTEEQIERERKMMEKMKEKEKAQYEKRKEALVIFLEQLAAENRGEHIKR